MAYIGNDLRSNEDYKIIDDISSGFNGSATSFALQVGGATPVPFPKFEQQLLISVNGVIQEPDPTGSAGFKLTGTNIVFSSAPTNGHSFFGVIYAGADYVNAGGTFPDGSINFPSITFSADTDSGFTRVGSGTIALISNGTKIAQFPTSQGSSGQALITDGSGNLSFGVPTAAFTDITLADSIIHSGDTDTKIRFGGANEFSVETAGVERLEITPTEVTFNDTGTDTDFRIEGDTDANLFKVDAGNDRIGIGTASPTNTLDVQGGTSNTAIVARSTDSKAQISLVDNSTSSVGSVVVGAEGDNLFLTSGSGGSERMRINSSGDVGIGTSSPSRKLDVIGDAEFIHDNGIVIEATSTNTAGQLTIIGVNNSNQVSAISRIKSVSTDSSSAATATTFSNRNSSNVVNEHVRITSTGKVGMSNSSPQGELHVGKADNSNHEAMIILNNGGASGHEAGIEFRYESGTTPRAKIHVNSSDKILRFSTDDAERMRIDGSGNIGIGTTSPSSKLDIAGNIALTASDPKIFFNTGGSMISNANVANTLAFFTDGSTERARINSSGKVGIGTTTIGEKLTIGDGDLKFFNSDEANNHRTTFIEFTSNSNRITSESNYGSDGSSAYSAGYKFTTKNFTGSAFETVNAFNIQANGNVGVGTTAVNHHFVSHGDSSNKLAGQFLILNNSFNSTVLQAACSRNTTNESYNHFKCSINGVADKMVVRDSGDVDNTNNSYGSLSDERLKENIVDASSQWDDIKALRIRKFNFKDTVDPNKPTLLGVIAQEVEAICPNLVKTSKSMQGGEEKEYKSFKYSVLYMKAIKCLQEAQAKIETLETKVAALEAA